MCVTVIRGAFSCYQNINIRNFYLLEETYCIDAGRNIPINLEHLKPYNVYAIILYNNIL